MYPTAATYLFLLIAACHAQRLQPADVVIVVLSQPNSYDVSLAQDLASSVKHQAQERKQKLPVIHLVHEEFDHPGVWTILPLLQKLEMLHGKNGSWFLFCQSPTKVNVDRLMEVLQKLDPRQEKWMSHALRDRDATIIHHFALPNNPGGFKYPSFASGIIMSKALISRLAQRLKNRDYPKQADFSIDASHELALYIWDEGRGTVLTHSDAMCVRPGPHCITRPLSIQSCKDPVPKREIFFAVKTCSKFHSDRLPIVKRTWAKHAEHIAFFSDTSDHELGTIDLGVPNTIRGHCGKTMAIIRHLSTLSLDNSNIEWVVIADDDTILGVGRLQQLLSCYNSTEFIALGERYGYNVALPDNFGGYNYVTGGGGMVFSMPLVKLLAQPNRCSCPSDSTPDDMYIGICLAGLDVPVTHSPLFHQARPVDYAPEYLAAQHPVSFHKHWMVDPTKVYKDWFEVIDSKLSSSPTVHNEL